MPICLGLDLGTSKAAAVLVDTSAAVTLDAASRETRADLQRPDDIAEQSPAAILSALTDAVLGLEPALRSQVTAIGVTGQMHGVVLWNSPDDTSDLITWQDRRCLRDGFLEELQARTGDPSLRSGYGTATLAWLARHEPGHLLRYASSGTIQDHLVAVLCGAGRPLMDSTDAAGWGMYDAGRHTWDEARIAGAGIPASILPEVARTETEAGRLADDAAASLDLPAGIPVTVAIGDNQASLFGTLDAPERQVGLTLGTGAQVSVVLEREDCRAAGETSLEIRPYVDGRVVAVGASLAGGSAYAWLVNAIARMLEDLGLPEVPRARLYEKVIALGLASDGGGLRVQPSFAGERLDPFRLGSVEGIAASNFTIANLSAALAHGIAGNLKGTLPASLLEGRSEVVGSGNALRRSMLMRRAVQEVFGLPLRMHPGIEEAATGAALLAGRLVPDGGQG